MKVIIASNNKNKIREIKAIFDDVFDAVLSMSEAGLDMDIEENGHSFEENARIKARAVMEATHCAALADDSGLTVDALDGAPGIYSARYAGMHGDDEANNDKLLDVMKDVPDDQRQAAYRCAVVLVYPDGREYIGEGSCPGVILRERMGNGGFGYDPLFYMPGEHCSMAQLDPERKNQISHRARALEKLREQL